MLKFGTDGIRGKANTHLTAELAVAVGRASAAELDEPDWLLGWDTRISSEMLAAAFCAGVASAGKNVHALGEVPTAAIAYSSRRHGMPGAMVTASHNPYADNGIKVFGRDGVKLPSSVEGRIEDAMESPDHTQLTSSTGRIQWAAEEELRSEYRQWLIGRAQRINASALSIAVDSANGAAYQVGPAALEATGARVRSIASAPNGRNINDQCGSTYLENLSKEVVGHGLDFGLAFDGDADRLLAVDADGELIDGDEIIAIIALHRARSGRLVNNGVVVTEWSNSGLHNSLRSAGIQVEVCPVGDKAVAEAMSRTGFTLGGEQSGHVIMRDFLQVGDGVSTAIELVSIAAEAGSPLRDVARSAMRKLPQRTTNIHVTAPPRSVVAEVAAGRAAIERTLGDSGRLVLRASGTERLVRVMVEAEDWDSLARVEESAKQLLAPYSG